MQPPVTSHKNQGLVGDSNYGGMSKYYYGGVSKYYYGGVSKYYYEYKYARQSEVECIGVAREARPPYGVSGKEDPSNTRESI